jgi:hypothetical protein
MTWIQKVQQTIKKEGIPKGRRTIKRKWIFKIKRNGTFRSRFVACGDIQVTVVDFNESFFPVLSKVLGS